MLVGLTIRNVVLIESLSLDFAAGLCALTGETGSGKSILLDALGLALGERSDAMVAGDPVVAGETLLTTVEPSGCSFPNKNR